MRGHTLKHFDYQKDGPDSEISDAGSISAPLAGEELIDAVIPQSDGQIGS
jgi:hypothetical protein